jgi:hypothetical protein
VIDVPDLVERPALRCFAFRGAGIREVCGDRAVWMSPPRGTLESSFFCDRHRPKDGVPIAADAVFRRIAFDVEVRFAAASLIETTARVDALARLESAVVAAGGRLSVGRVTSVVGRLRPQAGQGGGAAEKGRGE